MPAPQRGLLRATPGLARLGLNSREIPGSCLTAEALADAESTACQPRSRKGLASKEALASTAPQALLPPEPEPSTAAQARALHMRRELHQALDHGLALMDALDLSPRGLDLMDRAIAQLDAFEAPEEDLEPWLAGYQNLAEVPLDAEDDSEEDEGTSLETFGRGCARGGADDAEDGSDDEQTNEDGSDDGRADHGWFAGEFDVPQVMRGMMEDFRRRPAVPHG